MSEIWMDVDAALSEVPVNKVALIDDTDFKTREESVTYDQSGMDLVWNFVTTTGAYTQTAVTPTTAGDYDWTNQGNGMYSIEITASGGASINNDTEGFGWFTGFATGILPWTGPIIGFRSVALNNTLIDGSTEAFYSFYAGPRGPGVYINDAAGNTNTVNGVDGTVGNPVSTIAAAKTIADSMSLDRVYLVNDSAITLAATMEDYEFVGIGDLGGNVITLGSQDVDGSYFENAVITGAQGGTGRFMAHRCGLLTLTSLEVMAWECAILGNLTVRQDSFFDKCWSAVAGNGTPTLDINSVANVNISWRHYSGGLQIDNAVSTTTVSYETDGQVIVDATCTSLALTVRGNCSITDNGTTTSLTQDGAINRTGIATPTNITAGTITTVTNLTNAPTSGDLTATMKTSVTTAATAATPIAASVSGNVDGSTASVTGAVGSVSGNVDGSVGSVTGAVGSVTGAVGSVAGNVDGNVTGSVGSLAAQAKADVLAEAVKLLVTQMTESYAADGAAPTLAQSLMLIQQMLTEFAISGTTLTTKKVDGSTTAATFTLDDGTNPTSLTRAT